MNPRSRVPFPPARPSFRPATFERAYFAEVLAACEPFGGESAATIAKSLWPDDRTTPDFLTRMVASPADTATDHWASQLTVDVVGDFVASLAPVSPAARLVSAGVKLSLNGVNSVDIPRRSSVKPAANLAWVAQSGAIAVKGYTLDSVKLGPTSKLAIISALTREMVSFSGGEQVVTTMLREDVAATLDATVFSDAAAVVGTSPAGLLNGVTPLTATAGGGDSAMLADLEALSGMIADAGGSSIAFIMATRQALAANLRLRRSDAVTVWPCWVLTPGTVIAVEVNAFASAIGQARIQASTEAVLHFSDTPLPIVEDGTVAEPVYSTFQQDLVAIRCILDAVWCMRAAGMISYLTDASWGGTAPT